MSSEVTIMLEAFAEALVEREEEDVRGALAEWLREPEGAERLLSELRDAEKQFLLDHDLDEGGIGGFEIDEETRSKWSLRTLRRDSDGVPDEVTEDNYVGTYSMQAIGDEDSDYVQFFTLLVAVVVEDGDYYVGHYELIEAE
ncbi:MAG: hypothetical protein HUU55_17780 [Myxococcales bacterium]|nr:hypothetical protein [Myxococcales bacterium]